MQVGGFFIGKHLVLHLVYKEMKILFAAGTSSSEVIFYPQFSPFPFPCHFHYNGDLVCLLDSDVSFNISH